MFEVSNSKPTVSRFLFERAEKNSTIDAASSNKLSVNVMQQLVVHNRKDPCLSIWRRNEFWMLDAFWRISFATYKPIMRRRKGEK